MNRNYEVIFIVRPDLADEEADKLVAGLEATVTHAGGTLRKTERLGKRRLAYRVRGFREGNYVLFDMEGPPEPVHELQRRLRVSEPVIKFLTVRMDELQRRFDKDQRRREARLKKRPAAHAPAAAEAGVGSGVPAPAAEITTHEEAAQAG